MRRDPFDDRGRPDRVRPRMPPPPPAYRVRRRMAGFTALSSTVMSFLVLTAAGMGAQSDAPVRASGEPVLSPAIRAGKAVGTTAPPNPYPRVNWRQSRPLGQPTGGSLMRATKLPEEGLNFITWDPARNRTPNAMWRRYGTGHLVRVVLTVAAEFRRAHPEAARLVIGDLSRPRGGSWGAGAHASHQNGLDVDIYYPRYDKRERAPASVGQINHRLAQELVNRFVRKGARYVFVGPNTRLTGPGGVVMVWPNHDNHLHVRLPRG